MQRRVVLKGLAGLPLAALVAGPAVGGAVQPVRGVRPGEPGWPDPAEWAKLRRSVGGRLVQVRSPFEACTPDPASPGCTELFQSLRDPFSIGDSVALTQTLGWTDAWTTQASAYAVLAQHSADVAAAVDFARHHRVRLVVKGAVTVMLGLERTDSLLIWTRPNMGAVELHDRFVPRGAAGLLEPEAAVSVGAGAIWMEVYDAVTTRAGRYVQGGGCTTVGVPGLVLGGGFGSFSKGFGTAAANLLEAEVVTADGAVCIANAVRNRELFWALKGGGGGTFGVVTRLTLRTHALPGLLRCGAGDDHRSVGRRLCGAGRAGAVVLPRAPAEPALGRGAPLWPRTPDQRHHGLPGLTRAQAERPGRRCSPGSPPARPTTP